MKLCCIKKLSTRPSDYDIGKYYIVDEIWLGIDFTFNRPEKYYRIYDNFGDTHDFDKSGLDEYFITISKERKLKLEKLYESSVY